MQFIGGSSYIGGCNAAYPITYLPGVTGTVPGSQTMPGGSNRSDYIPEVGVGKVGAYDTLLPGGNGAIVLTFIPKTSFSPSKTPSPSTALPTYAPSVKPTTAQPTTAPSTIPTTTQPISLPIVPTNQLPICPDGWTLKVRYSCQSQWTKADNVILEDSPVSNDVYQQESLDTVLPSLSSEIKYAVGGFVAGITLMLVLYFFTRASKEKYVYPNRTEYTPIMEHE